MLSGIECNTGTSICSSHSTTAVSLGFSPCTCSVSCPSNFACPTADGTEIPTELLAGPYSGGFSGACGAEEPECGTLNLAEPDSWEAYRALLEDGRYTITEKGSVNSEACESSLPYSVRRRCNQDLAAVNAILRRSAQIRGEAIEKEDGSLVARMTLDDDSGNLLTIELLCPSKAQADRLIAGFKARPERVYNEVLELLSAKDEEE